MIQSFKHKGLAELFKTGSHARVQAKHVARLKLILSLLNAATHTGQLNAPGLRLHPLKGKPIGRYAAWAQENFRVIFRFEAKHAGEVDYGDYT
jgi:proteic killer suppression protein